MSSPFRSPPRFLPRRRLYGIERSRLAGPLGSIADSMIGSSFVSKHLLETYTLACLLNQLHSKVTI